jgi:hypothetical protein
MDQLLQASRGFIVYGLNGVRSLEQHHGIHIQVSDRGQANRDRPIE